MGTRADFYVGRGANAEWLGSIAFDGYPDGVREPRKNPLSATTESVWRERIAALLARRDDATTPDLGWPWPWEDSGTTDYAYAFDGGRVWGSRFGSPWFDALAPEPEEHARGASKVEFPDMSARQKLTLGKRSGCIVIAGGKIVDES